MAGIISNPPTPVPAGLRDTIEEAGHVAINEWDATHTFNVWMCDDPVAVQAIISTYSGSASELAWWKAQHQAALDELFNANFDLAKFIRAGTATGITAQNVGNFLVTITNNYRTLRADIAAATTVAGVQAIVITSGWPANP